MRSAHNLIELGQNDLAREIIEEYIPEPGEPDRRGFEWHHLRARSQPYHQLLSTELKQIVEMKFLPGSHRVVVVGLNGEVQIWEGLQGKRLHSWQAHKLAVRAMAVSRDGTRIATADESGLIKIWNASNQQIENTLSNDNGVQSIAFSPTGDRLAINIGGHIRLWQLGSDVENHSLGTVEANRLAKIKWPTEKLIVTIHNQPNQLRFWDLETEKSTIHDLRSPHDFAVSRDGSVVVMSCGGNFNQAWLNDELITFLTGALDTSISTAITQDGEMVAYGCKTGDLIAMDLETREFKTFLAHMGRVTCCEFSDDESYLATVGPKGEIKLWDIGRGWRMAAPRLRQDAQMRGLAFSSNSRVIAAVASSGKCLMRDVETLRLVDVKQLEESYLVRIAFSPDDRYLYVREGFLKFSRYDLLTREVLRHPFRDWQHTDIAINPHAAFTSRGPQLWEWKHNEEAPTVWPPLTARILAVGALRDRTEVVVGCADGQVRIYDGVSRRQLAEFTLKGRVGAVALSPDSQTVYSGLAAGEVIITDVASESQIGTMQCGDFELQTIDISPDGQRLVCTTEGGGVWLWDLLSLQLISHFTHPVAPESDIAMFSPDGKTLAIGWSEAELQLLLSERPRQNILANALLPDRQFQAISWQVSRPNGRKAKPVSLPLYCDSPESQGFIRVLDMPVDFRNDPLVEGLFHVENLDDFSETLLAVRTTGNATVRLNGNPVAEIAKGGMDFTYHWIQLDPKLLRLGENQLSIQVREARECTIDTIFVDARMYHATKEEVHQSLLQFFDHESPNVQCDALQTSIQFDEFEAATLSHLAVPLKANYPWVRKKANKILSESKVSDEEKFPLLLIAIHGEGGEHALTKLKEMAAVSPQAYGVLVQTLTNHQEESYEQNVLASLLVQPHARNHLAELKQLAEHSNEVVRDWAREAIRQVSDSDNRRSIE